MKQIRLQQGDSFTMTLVLKENGQVAEARPGETVAVGLYGENCDGVILKSTNNNQIKKDSKNKCYIVKVTSDITRNFIGNVDVEIVVYDSSGKDVSHADKVLKLFFEERRINDEIKKP